MSFSTSPWIATVPFCEVQHLLFCLHSNRYFTTSIPGSGIFLPAYRATRQGSSSFTNDSAPSTPTTPSFSNPDLNKASQDGKYTPPTPSVSKLSQSLGPGTRTNFSKTVGPGARAPSPQLKAPKSRPSLPRPESPLRKQPSLTPVSGRPSAGQGFSQSVRGNRPSGISPGPKGGLGASKISTPRSQSRSQSQATDRSPDGGATPIAASKVSNGIRPHSRAAGRTASNDGPINGENERLRRSLEERDKQLKEQAASLAEMESSLAELQSMVAANSKSQSSGTSSSREDLPVDAQHLRTQLREKNEKIAMLTAEFDAHRADFRSTIDTLEMASTETERVYEKRVQELLQEVQEFHERGGDVDAVARQLRQLEELVQELEEGLEDARRGEAEARSEVEFLRGEVERGRSELAREREKAAKALKGATGAVGDRPSSGGMPSRDVEQRDDEIRGLKAIIHSLSSGPDVGSPRHDSPVQRNSVDSGAEMARLRADMETLSREKGELQGLIERKGFREEELERELTSMRSKRPTSTPQDMNGGTSNRNHSDSVASTRTAIRPSTGHSTAPSGADLGSFPQPPNKSLLSSAALSESKDHRPGTGSSAGGPTTFHDASEAPGKSMAPAPLFSADGPAPGKHSKVVDMNKWCALCEKDGHESVDCPFEEDF